MRDVVAFYRSEWEMANQIVRDASSLDDRAAYTKREDGVPTLRWIVNHMIEETARHAGHADITRELIDAAYRDIKARLDAERDAVERLHAGAALAVRVEAAHLEREIRDLQTVYAQLSAYAKDLNKTYVELRLRPLERDSAERPVMLCLEDLHWALSQCQQALEEVLLELPRHVRGHVRDLLNEIEAAL